LFETLEKTVLKPLPVHPYVYAEWKSARVNIDYHICCFAHYFDATFLIRLMDSDYFEGSHIGGLPFVFFRSVRSKPIAHVLH
jgi:hypothetical protein